MDGWSWCVVNASRVAAALRLLADAIEDDVPSATNVAEQEKRKKRVREPYRPDAVVSDEASAKADAALRRLGLLKTGG